MFGLAKARHRRRLQVGETHAGQTVKHMEKDHHMYDLSPEDVSFYLDGENFEEFHQK